MTWIWFFYLLLPSEIAFSSEPSDWERRNLPQTPVSVLIPTGSMEQPRGQNRPGFDEVQQGWLLQTLPFYDGTARFILYLRHGSITVWYHRNDPMENYRTLDDYLHDIVAGMPWEDDQYGNWKGFPTRLVGRKDKPPPPGEPYGITAIHAVEFGPREYLVVELSSNPDYVSSYLPYFSKVKNSIKYSGAAKPGRWASAQKKTKEPRKRRLLLPSNDPYYPYKNVEACPPGKNPLVENWPNIGDAICR